MRPTRGRNVSRSSTSAANRIKYPYSPQGESTRSIFWTSQPQVFPLWLAGLIALAGDVETNPGPIIDRKRHTTSYLYDPQENPPFLYSIDPDEDPPFLHSIDPPLTNSTQQIHPPNLTPQPDSQENNSPNPLSQHNPTNQTNAPPRHTPHQYTTQNSPPNFTSQNNTSHLTTNKSTQQYNTTQYTHHSASENIPPHLTPHGFTQTPLHLTPRRLTYTPLHLTPKRPTHTPPHLTPHRLTYTPSHLTSNRSTHTSPHLIQHRPIHTPSHLTPHRPIHTPSHLTPHRPTHTPPQLTSHRPTQLTDPPILTPHSTNSSSTDKNQKAPTTKNSKLKILQININGLSNKIKELELLIHDVKADIVTVQETKLTQNSKTPKILNYTSIRKDRTYNKGGGLIIYVKNNITFTNNNIPQIINQNFIELQLITLHLTPKKQIQIANIYIPPSNTTNQNQTNEDNDIKQCINYITSTPNSIITGDINAHSTLWY